jgi:phytol kinase
VERAAGLGKEGSRKLVHIAVGHYQFVAFATIGDKYIAAAPMAVFVVLNAISLRTKLFAAIETEARASWGTLYYPLALAILTLALYDVDRVAIGVGVVALAWGDGMAAIVGNSFGRHKYRVWSQTRSFEGSAAMGLASFASIMVTLALMTGADVSAAAGSLARASAPLALAAALIEGTAWRDTDNLAVPLGVAALYHFHSHK